MVRNSIALLQNARVRRNKLGIFTSRAGTDSIVRFGGDRVECSVVVELALDLVRDTRS